MNVLLDPNLYCFTDVEWNGGSALDRMESVIRLLTEIDDAEEEMEIYGTKLFVMPDDLLVESFGMNPNINVPPNDFYHRQFTQKVLPALMRRRVDIGGLDAAPEECLANLVFNDCIIREHFQLFLETLSKDIAASIAYAYHSERVSLALNSAIFLDEVAVDQVDGIYFLDELQVFPLEAKKLPETALKRSLQILHAKLSRHDATWRDFQVCNLFFHQDFLPSISKADFRDFILEYKCRILYCLLQVASGRVLTTKEHSMNPQKIRFANNWHGKWNAYVFQNGPSERDVRCSRVYFAKIEGGVLLHEFDGDVH